MAINWTTLTAAKAITGSLANWCNRSDLATTNILLEAEAWIYQRLRVREMMMDEAFTFAISTSSTALSSLTGTFLDPIQFVPYEWGVPLPFYDEASYRPSRNSAGTIASGLPSYWAIIGSTAHVDVLCSAAFAGRMMYYAQPAALSVSNETNFLTTRYPTLLRHALMGKAYEHMKDPPRAQEYLQYAEMNIAEAMRTNDMFRRGQYAAA